jgi:nucleoside-diphosphate-sugar epimerase
MRVLVTGAAGNLGRVVLPALADAGHEPIAFDQRAVDTPHEAIQGDLRDPEVVGRAVRGIDAIVHGAALHGVHLRNHPPREFWEINVTGTFNVFEAARELGVRRMVLSSTMGVYGQSLRRAPSAFAWTSEADALLPGDVYGVSKVLCEEMGAYYARAHGLVTVALRFGMYVPESFVRYGFRLLFGGVDDRDVADAVVRSLAYEPAGGFDAFDVMALVPFVREDAAAMAADPAGLIERHWPGTVALARERGADIGALVWGETLWPIDKARRQLGWSPRHNFGEFLDAWRAGDESYYPFAGFPQWGV